MSNLATKKCVSCEGGVSPMSNEEAEKHLKKLGGWAKADLPAPLSARSAQAGRWTSGQAGKKIHKLFTFKNFKEAMAFVNKVAYIAESEGHHPDISIHYNKVDISLWTHAVGGLSLNDFIVVAKIDALN